MKKIATAFFIISAISPLSVFADPSIITFEFTCPTTSGGGYHILRNFGTQIAGYGIELINGVPAFNSPYFKTPIANNANIPTDLSKGSYTSSGTHYDNVNAVISCSYTSSSSFNPFTVSYNLFSNLYTQVVSQSANSITILQFIG